MDRRVARKIPGVVISGSFPLIWSYFLCTLRLLLWERNHLWRAWTRKSGKYAQGHGVKVIATYTLLCHCYIQKTTLHIPRCIQAPRSEKIKTWTWYDVFPVDRDVVIWSALLVYECQGVKKLVHDYAVDPGTIAIVISLKRQGLSTGSLATQVWPTTAR